MDDGPTAIADAVELAQIRLQARGINLKTLALAAILTALAVWLPL